MKFFKMKLILHTIEILNNITQSEEKNFNFFKLYINYKIIYIIHIIHII